MFEKIGAVLGVLAIAISVGGYLTRGSIAVSDLEEKVENLTRTVAELNTEIEANSEQVNALSDQLQSVSANVGSNQSRLSRIEPIVERLSQINHAIWEDVTSNTDEFNPQCLYRWHYISGPRSYIYATEVFPDNIHATYQDQNVFVDYRDKSQSSRTQTRPIRTWELCIDTE